MGSFIFGFLLKSIIQPMALNIFSQFSFRQIFSQTLCNTFRIFVYLFPIASAIAALIRKLTFQLCTDLSTVSLIDCLVAAVISFSNSPSVCISAKAFSIPETIHFSIDSLLMCIWWIIFWASNRALFLVVPVAPCVLDF